MASPKNKIGITPVNTADPTVNRFAREVIAYLEAQDQANGRVINSQYLQWKPNTAAFLKADGPCLRAGLFQATTTNATQTRLCTIKVPLGGSQWHFAVMARGASNEFYSRGQVMTIHREGDTITQLDSSTSLWEHDDDAAWDASWGFLGGENVVAVLGTGQANTRVEWTAFVWWIETG